jgi:hypothetical protein
MNSTANEKAKQDAMTKIAAINAVEGFDPSSLVLEIGDLNDGSKRQRLPVKVQMAWFRLKYPEGRIAVTVKPVNNFFVADAKVYVSYKDPAECFLAEASASRGFLAEKPTVSPREWAQTAAIGMALRNAGFGLNADIAGENFEENTLNELSTAAVTETPKSTSSAALDAGLPADATICPPAQAEGQSGEQFEAPDPPPAQPEQTPLEKAMVAMCPIGKYKDKTLGEMVRIDPKALVYVSNNGAKYGAEIAESARLICEAALQETA